MLLKALLNIKIGKRALSFILAFVMLVSAATLYKQEAKAADPQPGSARIYVEGNKFIVGEEKKEIFINGANAPWFKSGTYAWDGFGYNNSPNQSQWDTHFRELKAIGVNAVRIWVFCSGSNGININSSGYVSGITDAAWKHLDAFFKSAEENKMYVMLTPISFDSMINNTNAFRKMFESEENTLSYVNNLLIPIVNRYKDNDYFWSVDFVNEIEWISVEEKDSRISGSGISWTNLQRFIALSAIGVHQNSEVLVTQGMACVKNDGKDYDRLADSALQAQVAGNPDKALAFTDFSSTHYYEWELQWYGNPFTMSPAAFGFKGNKPVVIGEFPSLGSGKISYGSSKSNTVTEDYWGAYTNGYNGAMAWTSTGIDGCGGYNDLKPATLNILAKIPGLVFPLDDNNAISLSSGNLDTSSGILTIPNAAVGYTNTGYTQVVTVKNTGTSNVSGLTVSKSGTGAANFTVSELSGTSASSSVSPTFNITPVAGLAAGTYTMTVTVTGSNSTSYAITVSFSIYGNDEANVTNTLAALTFNDIKGGNDSPGNINQNLVDLPTSGVNGTKITWTSSAPAVISTSGQVTVTPASNKACALTATVTSGSVTKTRVFNLTVKGQMIPYKSYTFDSDAEGFNVVQYDNTTALAGDPISQVSLSGIGGALKINAKHNGGGQEITKISIPLSDVLKIEYNKADYMMYDIILPKANVDNGGTFLTNVIIGGNNGWGPHSAWVAKDGVVVIIDGVEYYKLTVNISIKQFTNLGYSPTSWTGEDFFMIGIQSANYTSTMPFYIDNINFYSLDMTGYVAVTGVTLNASSIQLASGGTYQLIPTITPENASNTNVTWTTSNSTRVTVDANGLLKGGASTSNSSTTITVTTGDGNFTKTMTVSAIVRAVSGVSAITNVPTASMAVGASVTLGGATVSTSGSSGTAVITKVWSSSDPAVATVSAAGVVTAVGTGTAVITAAATVDSSKFARCTLQVIDKTGLTEMISAVGDLDEIAIPKGKSKDSDEFTNLSSALTAAVGIAGNAAATQAEINEAVTNLQSALDIWNTEIDIPEPELATFSLSSSKDKVNVGGSFDVSAGFDKAVESNIATISVTYDATKYQYNGFTAADGVSVLDTRLGAGSVRLTVSVADYATQNYGDFNFTAIAAVVLDDPSAAISAKVDYVVRGSEGVKTIQNQTSALGVAAGELIPGDTNGDSKVNLIDLSNLLEMVGKTNGDADWADYADFDLFCDGKIDDLDIYSLAVLIDVTDIGIESEAQLSAGTDAKTVRSGEEFVIDFSFDKPISTNTYMINMVFDTELFKYIGCLKLVEGVNLITWSENDNGATFIFQNDGAELEDLGNIMFDAKENVDLTNGNNGFVITAVMVETIDGAKAITHSSASVNVATSGSIFGDINGDGVFDLIDLSNLIDSFGLAEGEEGWDLVKEYDLNNSGVIDINDIAELAKLLD